MSKNYVLKQPQTSYNLLPKVIDYILLHARLELATLGS